MKKVLFATTALVASAGIASAQGVTLSGSAEMGIFGGTDLETQFHHDIDVTFTLSGETDNGLTFGATIDLDELNGDAINPAAGGTCRAGTLGSAISGLAGSGACPGAENNSSVFLSGNFGTLTMGDTDGAFDWAMQDLDILGDISDANTTHVGFNGNGGLDGSYDGQVVRYDYSFGEFAFAVSLVQDDSVVVGPAVYAVGGKYTAALGTVNLGVGLGYQSNGTTDLIGLSLDADFNNGLRAVLNYTDYSSATINATPLDGGTVTLPVNNHIGVGLFYSMDAISVGLHYGQYDIGGIAGIADRSGVGLVAHYDLGGGAVVQFGYSSGQAQSFFGPLGTTVSSDRFSLGVAMSF